MRVFVTGASGFIGSAVVPELIGAGHEVVGLARSDASASALEAAGARVHRGSLEDVESLRSGAAAADGVVHLAYIHDFSNIGASAEVDEHAIEAIGSALAGSDRPLVVASGVGVVERLRRGDALDASEAGSHRLAAGKATLELAGRGVRSSLVGLPPTVHGEGDRAFVPALVEVARRTGVSAYVGDGSNRWSAVHRLDAARLFRLALEGAPAGSALPAVEDEGIELRTIAETVGRRLGLPVRSVAPEDAAAHFGWIAGFLTMAAAASGAPTRDLLGWQPDGPGLVEDLERGHYFAAPDPAIGGRS